MQVVNVKQQVAQTVVFFVAFALALFIPAGTIAWPAGWIFWALFLGFYVGVNAWLFKHNPGLLQERTRLGSSDQKGWDKILFPAMLIFTFLWLIFISLDAARFHWSFEPTWLQVIGALVLLSSFYLLFLVFRENSYLSPVVRIQADRGHTVVSTGPYHYVRHPMYAGIIVFAVGTPLLLGSWAGVVVGFILVAVLAWRVVLEERTLRAELPGYVDYAARVGSFA